MVDRRTGENSTEQRDLLIQSQTILTKLSEDLNDIKKENIIEHNKLIDKVDTITGDKLSNKWFFWVIGIIIAAIMGLTSFVGNLSEDVTTNKAKIENLYDK